jgi:hypothetical protein
LDFPEVFSSISSRRSLGDSLATSFHIDFWSFGSLELLWWVEGLHISNLWDRHIDLCNDNRIIWAVGSLIAFHHRCSFAVACSDIAIESDAGSYLIEKLMVLEG